MTDARRDVSWSVVFRMEDSSDWNEWSRWPTSGEAVAKAEALVKIPVVAEIRFERVIVQRDRYSLHDLAVLDDTKADTSEASLTRVRALHERMEGYGDFDYCDVCSNHGDIRWPCATIRAIEEA